MAKPIELPPDVAEADVKWPTGHPQYTPEQKEKLEASGFDYYQPLTFYKTSGFGWVLTTLLIGKGRGNQPDRYYGYTLDGKSVRVGRGPHVTAEVGVYLSPANFDRLFKYVELWSKGMAAAGGIRDRISSRRAQGQEHRALGHSSWRWDSAF